MYERSPQKSPQLTILNLLSDAPPTPQRMGTCAEKGLKDFGSVPIPVENLKAYSPEKA
jgi:hypothetical protein